MQARFVTPDGDQGFASLNDETPVGESSGCALEWLTHDEALRMGLNNDHSPQCRVMASTGVAALPEPTTFP